MATATAIDRTRPATELLRFAATPSRFYLILALRGGPKSVKSLCEELSATQPQMSHNLAVGRLMGILDSNRIGQRTEYGLTKKGKRLLEVIDLLATID